MANIEPIPMARAKHKKMESRCSVTVILYLTFSNLSSLIYGIHRRVGDSPSFC